MNVLFTGVLLLALYVIPGFFFSRFFAGKLRNSPFIWLLFSFLLIPFFYMLLVHTNVLHLEWFFGVLALFGVSCFLLSKRLRSSTNLDGILSDNSHLVLSGKARVIITSVLIVFFFLLITPRIGLFQGYLPIGDDRPRVGQTLSIAASPHLPVHFRLPGTEMSIYYFNMVQPGLLTRFTDNFVKVNQSWFIHLVISYILFTWFIRRMVYHFARSVSGSFVMVVGLTLGSGMEYYLAKIRNITYSHLEWWTDWFFPGQSIHLQISSPYTSTFWVTQHTFAAFLAIFVYLIISSKEVSKTFSWILIGLIFAAIAGNSIFVCISLALAYGLYYLARLFLRKEKFSSVLKMNLVVGSVAVILFSSIAYIYLNSGKQDYFVLQTSVFHFLPNSGVNKLVNIMISVPLYLLVELNLFFFVYLYSLYIFYKEKRWSSDILFLYLLTLPFAWMFFIRAKGDNNLSMRGTLPALMVLAIFGGRFIEDVRKKFFFQKRVLFYMFLSVFILVLIPTTLYEYSTKIGDQFHSGSTLFTQIDQKLPLASLVFIDDPVEGSLKIPPGNYDSLTHIAHRFTFKPVEYFDITDIEYTSQKAKDKYAAFSFAYLGEINELLSKEKELKDLSAYLISERNFEFPIVLEDNGYRVYKIR